MRKVTKSIFILISIFLLISFTVLALILVTLSTKPSSLWGLNNAEGVVSLTIFLKHDIENYNIMIGANNLTNAGYKPIISGKNDCSDWSISTIWKIPDDNYGRLYTYNISVTLYGFNSTNIPSRSFIKADFIPASMDTNPTKKTKDKNFSKTACFEIASLLGVELDWERHTYIIGWSSMTSEGIYEEE